MDFKNILENLTCQTNRKNTFKIESCKPNIFLHFWATWCPPCRNELPDLQKIYDEYNSKVDFLFISCDNEKRTIDTFISNENLTIPIGYDLNNVISNSFNIRSIPSSFFIKKTDNFIVKNIVGSINYPTLKESFEKFVNINYD